MIKISGDVYVAAEQIAEIGLTSDRRMIYVKTKAREIHHIPIPWGQSAYQVLDKLVIKIDEELK